MTRYAVAHEPIAIGYSAFAPDPIDIYLKSMREDGDPIPEPSHVADMVEVA